MGKIVTIDELFSLIAAYNASASATSIGSVIEGMPAKLTAQVVDVEDDTVQCRIKAHIDGLTRTTDNEIPQDDLPWLYASPGMLNMYDVPAIGDWVIVDMSRGIYHAFWEHLDARSELLAETVGDDIATTKVLLLEDASRFGSEGAIGLYWSPTQGWMWEFANQHINLRADGTLYITDGAKAIHLTADGKISIGSETESAEPGVLGLQAETTFNQLNDAIKALSDNMATVMQTLAQAAKSNPYVMPLSPCFESYASTVQQPETQAHQAIAEQIPKTKSEVVTID